MIPGVTTPRRTLPAPSEPVSLEAVLAERDKLRVEVITLRSEVTRLREDLARREADEPSDTILDDSFDRLAPASSPAPLAPGRKAPAPHPAAAPDHVPTGGPIDVAMPTTTSSGTGVSGGLDFGTVSRLSPAELDTLPYGLICLDAQGRVVHYNDTESRLAQLPRDRVIGKSFFGEVAPCARVREFEGQFLELVRDPGRVRVRTFDFVFRFRHSEQHVTIVMTPARTRGLYNIALLRRSIDPT